MVTFTNILPDPNNLIGRAGESDPTTGSPGPGYASVKLSSMQPIMKTRVNSGRLEVTNADFHKWIIDITYNSMPREEFDPVFTFLRYRDTTLQPFLVSLPQYADQGITDKVSLGAHIKGSPTLLITGTGVTPGSVLQILGNTKIYQVTRVETETDFYIQDTVVSAGTERLHITPGLQESITGGETVSFTDVLFTVVQMGETSGYTLNDKTLFSFGLKLEEII
jgi:hypothetical protein